MKENYQDKYQNLSSNYQDDIRNLERAVEYYKNLADEVAGYNVLVDSITILLKGELEQKRLGNNILKKLHDIIGSKINPESFFISTLKLVLTHLNMDRTLVLWNHSKTGNVFKVRHHMGYNKKELEYLQNENFDFNGNGQKSILINKSTKKTEWETDICNSVLLPYLVGTAIYNRGRVIGWLIGGREKEARPFYPPLNAGDLETFEIMGGFIKATISNYNLYAELEQANLKLETYNKELESKVEERTRTIEISRKELEREKIKTDNLLLNILPADVAEELKETGQATAKSFDLVHIMFTDFENFTNYADESNPTDLVNELHVCFTKFDQIASKYGIEKIKTIGDSYMCVGGLTIQHQDAVANVVKAGLEMQEYINERKKDTSKGALTLNMRVGINSGPVVAGVVGFDKFQYDIWGDAVNMASRMESTAPSGAVNISKTTYELVKNYPEFNFEHRGKIKTKRKGNMEMWLVSFKP